LSIGNAQYIVAESFQRVLPFVSRNVRRNVGALRFLFSVYGATSVNVPRQETAKTDWMFRDCRREKAEENLEKELEYWLRDLRFPKVSGVPKNEAHCKMEAMSG